MAPALTQIAYASTAADTVTKAVVRSILYRARAHNAQADITGVLLSAPQSFVQLLEGPTAAVEALYERINQDPRHTDVELLFCRPATSRVFPEWRMGEVNFLDDLRDQARTRLETVIVNRPILAPQPPDFLAYARALHDVLEAADS